MCVLLLSLALSFKLVKVGTSRADLALPLADHGSNDPVARKILSKQAATSGLAPPADQDIVRFSLLHLRAPPSRLSPRPSTRCEVENRIVLTGPPARPQTSLFLTSLPATASEDSIRDALTSGAGIPASKIKSVVLVSSSKVSFVNFTSRDAAEDAAARCSVGLKVDSHDVKVQWGRSRPKKGGAGAGKAAPAAVVSEREIESSGQ